MDMQNLSAGQAFIDPYTGEEAFAVEPITNCPHALQLDFQKTQNLVKEQGQSLLWSKCIDCGNTNENWICLECNGIFCSRYVKGHMAEHNLKNQNHHIALSFSDLSFWCYSCDSYITNKDLIQMRKMFQRAKFNEGEFQNHKSGTTNKNEEQSQYEEVKQRAKEGNGYFIGEDINQSNAYQILILKQFEKDITIQKGILKGYVQQKKNQKSGSVLVKNEKEEVIGSVIRLNKNIDSLSRDKIAFLLNEIEGFPNQSLISFEQVTIGDEQLEIAIYVSDE